MNPAKLPIRYALMAILAAVLTAVAAPVRAEDMDHSQHAGHQMSAEDLATLRAKIPLYRGYTDEQINASMARMRDTQDYLSRPDVRHEIGVLGLGHGYGDDGDGQFKAAYGQVAGEYPTAVGLGMAMMSSGHIQSAVEQLEAAGAKTIVVLPTEIGEPTNLTRQWDYIFGRIDESAYLDVPRVQTRARVVFASTPTSSPVVARILTDNLKSLSRDPANEVGVIIAHGPTDADQNDKELRDLAAHAKYMKETLGLAEVLYATLQDDAPRDVRQANVDRLRARIQAATDAGQRVLVTPVLITGRGGVSQRIRKDLDGLTYELADVGLAESPRFGEWVSESIASATTADAPR